MFFLDEIRPRIFCATFHDHYHLCMTYARYSESHENDDPRWRELPVNMQDFHEYYSRIGKELTFTYPEDWAGFNLTDEIIINAIRRGIPDLNKWDQVLLTIFGVCVAEYPGQKFSLLGISRPMMEYDPEVYDHELAHALYYTDEKYKRRMDRLFNQLPLDKKDTVLQILKQWDYGQECLVDETQAYLATGIMGHLEFEAADRKWGLAHLTEPFEEAYLEFKESPFKKRTIIPFLGHK